MLAFPSLEIAKLKAAVLAHPDDESLWCGGLLLREPDWTVICCSMPSADVIRGYNFFNACEKLGVRAKMLPFAETRREPLQHLEIIRLSDYDIVLTHNHKGEYGHEAHQQVHHWVMENFHGPKLIIGYGLDRAADDLIVELTDQEYEQKIAALRCYDTPSDGGRPTWDALLRKFKHFDFRREYFKHA